jgi:hypothetical protein
MTSYKKLDEVIEHSLTLQDQDLVIDSRFK